MNKNGLCSMMCAHDSDAEAWMLRTDELEYNLPADLIAVAPAQPRDSARLMVVHGRGAGAVEHAQVRDLPRFLSRGDRLVFNTTRVLPARFSGVREDTGGKVGGLFLKQVGDGRWLAMLKARRFREGAAIRVHDAHGEPTGVVMTMVERGTAHGDDAAWVLSVVDEQGKVGADRTEEVLARIGATPLPPYILGARRDAHLETDDAVDRVSYQTVYADEPGSVAAPTAGLHFTPDLLHALEEGGIDRSDVLLHVGAGTFKPIEAEFVEEHPMHAELCELTTHAEVQIERTRKQGGSVIAIGTTAVRTLESVRHEIERTSEGHCRSGDSGGLTTRHLMETRLLIAPGHEWKIVDGMLTNFHLPRSTLLALVAARLEGGIGRVRELYAEAIAERYRFYSYGDAMLILP